MDDADSGPVGSFLNVDKQVLKQGSICGFGNAPCPIPDNGSDAAILLGHLNPAYNLAFCILRNQAEAEDAVQAAYERAIRHFGQVRAGSGRAWFLRIVRNCCYDQLRRLGVTRGDSDFDEDSHQTQAPNPEAALLQAERNELIRKSLEDLPVESREVLVLREFEQLSYSEIGAVTGIPIGTVMSRLSRARQRLCKKLLPHLESGALSRSVTVLKRSEL